FRNSALPRMSQPVSSEARFSRIMGVLPIESTRPFLISMSVFSVFVGGVPRRKGWWCQHTERGSRVQAVAKNPISGEVLTVQHKPLNQKDCLCVHNAPVLNGRMGFREGDEHGTDVFIFLCKPVQPAHG